MTKKMVGVRFKAAGKVYNFDCGAFVLKEGSEVIVETEHGLSFGAVVIPPVQYCEKSLKKPLKKVFRLASSEDFLQKGKNLDIEKEAFTYCVTCIKKLALDMNLFSVEAAFDQSRLTFFFTSVGRVDFRELIKMLVKKFKVMVAMKQVGIRSKAKICGGIGRCGRTTCCSSFMEKFAPVSIRMAKGQHLSLNPTKISGLCGRLMCCLTFEDNVCNHSKKKADKPSPPTDIPELQ
jgi:cell fate regulator YaaT (PSP1 superfamily)